MGTKKLKQGTSKWLKDQLSYLSSIILLEGCYVLATIVLWIFSLLKQLPWFRAIFLNIFADVMIPSSTRKLAGGEVLVMWKIFLNTHVRGKDLKTYLK